MTFEVDGIKYRLRFQHRYRPRTIMSAGVERKVTHDTVCFIEQLTPKGWFRVSAAASMCSSSDQYVKEVGRRLAVRRAIDFQWPRAVVNRPARSAAYRAYFCR
jgi:hypothetical protein